MTSMFSKLVELSLILRNHSSSTDISLEKMKLILRTLHRIKHGCKRDLCIRKLGKLYQNVKLLFNYSLFILDKLVVDAIKL